MIQSGLLWKDNTNLIMKKSNNTLGFLQQAMESEQRNKSPSLLHYDTFQTGLLLYSLKPPHLSPNIPDLNVPTKICMFCVRTIGIGTPAVLLTCLTISDGVTRSRLQLMLLYKIVHGLIRTAPSDYLTRTDILKYWSST